MTFSRPFPLLALAALLAGCSAAQPSATEPEPLPVEVVAANLRGGTGAVSAVGRVAHQQEMTLAFRVPGTLARLDADIGDRVGRGQILAVLDARDLAARVAQAEGDVRRSERAVARYAALSEAGAVARARYEDERTTLDQARAALRAAAFDHESAQLRTPTAGIVLERIAQAGETISPGQAVLRVASTASPLLVRMPIPEGQLARVRPGAPARLVTANGTVSGAVSRIGAQVDTRTGTTEIEIRLTTSRGLVSGMTGTVEIDAPQDRSAGIAAVPAEAVLEAKRGQAALFLLDRPAQRARRRVVRFVGFTGEQALVAGLPANALVITAGAGFVTDGQRVRVTGGER